MLHVTQAIGYTIVHIGGQAQQGYGVIDRSGGEDNVMATANSFTNIGKQFYQYQASTMVDNYYYYSITLSTLLQHAMAFHIDTWHIYAGHHIT